MEHRRALALAGTVVAVGASGVAAVVALTSQPAPKAAAPQRPSVVSSPSATPSAVPTVEVTRYVDVPVEPVKEAVLPVARARNQVPAAAVTPAERTTPRSEAGVPQPPAAPSEAGSLPPDDGERKDERQDEGKKKDGKKKGSKKDLEDGIRGNGSRGSHGEASDHGGGGDDD